ncbi:hypothetical protein FACS1894120_5570 [Clostridia bacterium]|nr:hypothetical protein FACS1894120_5570 [Clostridia bacterium]
MLTGLDSVPPILREVGKNMGLNKFRMLTDIEIPACMPYILAGIKVSFARSWRTVIAIETLVGVVLNNEGLGYLMTQQRSKLDIPGLFSTLIIIIIVGIFFEDVIFKGIEHVTIEKWGIKI